MSDDEAALTGGESIALGLGLAYSPVESSTPVQNSTPEAQPMPETQYKETPPAPLPAWEGTQVDTFA